MRSDKAKPSLAVLEIKGMLPERASQTEVASLLKLSRSRVYDIENEALRQVLHRCRFNRRPLEL